LCAIFGKEILTFNTGRVYKPLFFSMGKIISGTGSPDNSFDKTSISLLPAVNFCG
jgi:hypothetical protein